MSRNDLSKELEQPKDEQERFIQTYARGSTRKKTQQSEDMALNQQDQSMRARMAPKFKKPAEILPPPEGEEDYELKSNLVHLLPKFRGVSGDNPNQHLQEFHRVCENMKPAKVNLDRMKMKAFPFSLEDAAKTWILEQEASDMDTWSKVESNFLEKFFPASRTTLLKKAINNISQDSMETFAHYWERFRKLLYACPHHNVDKVTLIQNFYQGLTPLDRSMLDAAAGGALMNKSETAAWELIDMIASNNEQLTTRDNSVAVKAVKEMETSTKAQMLEDMGKKLDDVCSMVQQLALKVQVVHVQEDPGVEIQGQEEANAVGGFFNNNNNQQQRSQFNRNYQQPYQPYQQRPQYQGGNTYIPPGPKLGEVIEQLSKSTDERFNQTKSALSNIEKQLSHMATVLGRLDPSAKGRLPSQPEVNPKPVETLKGISIADFEDEEDETKPEDKDANKDQTEEIKWESGGPESDWNFDPDWIPDPTTQAWDIYGKEKVNISLLCDILSEPAYLNYLLENAKERKDVKPFYKVEIGSTISAFIKRKIPQKMVDPGVFTVPCVIGKSRNVRAMLDLGASVNVMSVATYKALNLENLKPANFLVELADRTKRKPEGILENLLVQIGGLVFPADFVVLAMERKVTSKSNPIILGRPFMKTSKTKIDVGEGTLSMEFESQKVHFDISDDRQKPEAVRPRADKLKEAEPTYSDWKKSSVDEMVQKEKKIQELEKGVEHTIKFAKEKARSHEESLRLMEEKLKYSFEKDYATRLDKLENEFKQHSKNLNRLATKVGESVKRMNLKFMDIDVNIHTLEEKMTEPWKILKPEETSQGNSTEGPNPPLEEPN